MLRRSLGSLVAGTVSHCVAAATHAAPTSVGAPTAAAVLSSTDPSPCRMQAALQGLAGFHPNSTIYSPSVYSIVQLARSIVVFALGCWSSRPEFDSGTTPSFLRSCVPAFLRSCVPRLLVSSFHLLRRGEDFCCAFFSFGVAVSPAAERTSPTRRRAASRPPHATPCRAASCHDMPFQPSMPGHAASFHAMPLHATPCCLMQAIPYHTMPGYATPCRAMPCHARPCHAHSIPCHLTIPCHSMPMPSYPMPHVSCHPIPSHVLPCPPYYHYYYYISRALLGVRVELAECHVA